MVEYVLIAISVVLAVISQVAQKYLAIDYNNASKNLTSSVYFYVKHPTFWLAMAALGASMLSWLLVLDSMEVGKAYPLLSIIYIVMLLVSRFLFKEMIPLRRWIGVTVIMVGVMLITQS